MPRISPEALQCAQDIVGVKDVPYIALVIEQYLRIARQNGRESAQSAATPASHLGEL